MRASIPAGFAAVVAVAALALAAHAQPPGAAPDPNAPKNPFAGDAAAVAEGRNLYNGVCTACHGADGAAGDFAPGLAVPGRSYARRTDAQVFNAVRNGIAGTPMPAHAGQMNDEQIWKVATYVIGLRGTAIDTPVSGDAAAGEAIFRGKGECSSCHMVRGQGGIVGPDLTNLAGLRKLNSITGALTEEGHRVYGAGGDIPLKLEPLPTYRPVRVVTADGRTLRGVLRNEDNYTLQMIGLDQRMHMLDRRTLKSVVYEEKSLMPADYDKRLTPTEFTNLMAYLTRLTNRSAVVTAARR